MSISELYKQHTEKVWLAIAAGVVLWFVLFNTNPSVQSLQVGFIGLAPLVGLFTTIPGAILGVILLMLIAFGESPTLTIFLFAIVIGVVLAIPALLIGSFGTLMFILGGVILLTFLLTSGGRR